ncbi:MAG: amidohydrolase family protein [Acidobacteriaceae bacterium]
MTLNRRTVLKGLAAGLVAAGVPACAQQSTENLGFDGSFRIWDAHSHLGDLPGNTPEERMAVLVRHMDRLGIERLILSQGYEEYDSHATPEQVRIENDRVMRAVRHFPDRAYGSLYLNPENIDFCLQEFDRCVRDGPMVCIGELETDVLCSSPALDPIVERAISMNVPILQHTWMKTSGNVPGESTPYDVVELATRHPKAQFICGHTGGNWELGIRIIRDTPNVCAGIAGSDPTSGFVEMAVRELGAERVVYGSDVGGRSFASQVAKVIGAEIPDSEKKLILGGNMRRLLQPVLKAKGLAS